MKIRTYHSLSESMFCPVCHRKVNTPFKGNTMNVTGSIKINCGSCNQGQILIQPSPKLKDDIGLKL